MQQIFSKMVHEVEEIMPIYLRNSYVPYSRQDSAVLLLLSDGSWLAGVRVENASFPLIIPPLMNALSTAVALNRRDVVMVVASEVLYPEDVRLANQLAQSDFETFEIPDTSYFYYIASGKDLPNWGYALSPLQQVEAVDTKSGIDLAIRASQNAYIPLSNFPVGCALVTADCQHYIAGCNVECADWQRTICGERNALGTAISYGLHDFSKMYLTCPKDYTGTPCGACRQVLYELAPNLEIVMDRAENAPFVITPKELLPYSFTGNTLKVE